MAFSSPLSFKKLNAHRNTTQPEFVIRHSSFLIMPLSVDIQFADYASDALAELKGVLSEGEINEVVGEAEAGLFRRHFVANGTNKKHWPTTYFWPRAARSVSWTAIAGGVQINVDQIGVRQRYEGGAIYPTGDHVHLSIPGRAEAYGHVPGDFTNLRLAFHHVGGRAQAFALVEADGAQAKSSRGQGKSKNSQDQLGGGVYFWLVNSVYQEPDPTVIPDNREIAATAKDALEDLVKQVRRNQTSH
jgi:hypothetical protein